MITFILVQHRLLRLQRKLENKTRSFNGIPFNRIEPYLFVFAQLWFSWPVTGFWEVGSLWGGGLNFDPRNWYDLWIELGLPDERRIKKG